MTLERQRIAERIADLEEAMTTCEERIYELRSQLQQIEEKRKRLRRKGTTAGGVFLIEEQKRRHILV